MSTTTDSGLGLPDANAHAKANAYLIAAAKLIVQARAGRMPPTEVECPISPRAGTPHDTTEYDPEEAVYTPYEMPYGDPDVVVEGEAEAVPLPKPVKESAQACEVKKTKRVRVRKRHKHTPKMNMDTIRVVLAKLLDGVPRWGRIDAVAQALVDVGGENATYHAAARRVDGGSWTAAAALEGHTVADARMGVYRSIAATAVSRSINASPHPFSSTIDGVKQAVLAFAPSMADIPGVAPTDVNVARTPVPVGSVPLYDLAAAAKGNPKELNDAVDRTVNAVERMHTNGVAHMALDASSVVVSPDADTCVLTNLDMARMSDEATVRASSAGCAVLELAPSTGPTWTQAWKLKPATVRTAVEAAAQSNAGTPAAHHVEAMLRSECGGSARIPARVRAGVTRFLALRRKNPPSPGPGDAPTLQEMAAAIVASIFPTGEPVTPDECELWDFCSLALSLSLAVARRIPREAFASAEPNNSVKINDVMFMMVALQTTLGARIRTPRAESE